MSHLHEDQPLHETRNNDPMLDVIDSAVQSWQQGDAYFSPYDTEVFRVSGLIDEILKSGVLTDEDKAKQREFQEVLMTRHAGESLAFQKEINTWLATQMYSVVIHRGDTAESVAAVGEQEDGGIVPMARNSADDTDMLRPISLQDVTSISVNDTRDALVAWQWT